VLTLGAASNHNGTALYEGVSVLFLAELFSISLDFKQQASIIFVTVLSSFGTAGAPGASLPVIAMMLGQVGVPPEAIGVILGLDRILDMLRTVINIIGDMVTAVCVNQSSLTDEAAA
jgi:DAACS family dicarboxylate/amino acid:cation (Na+ or H+) symporter